MGNNWAHSVGQYWLQLLQFLVYLIDLLSILLRCNGFARTQKTIVDQTGSKLPHIGHDPFFGASLALESALALPHGPTTELVITCCRMKSTFHRTSQCNWEMDRCCKEEEQKTRQNDDFFFSISSWGIHLSSFFTFQIFFKCQMTIEWLALFWATSHVVVRRSTLMITLNW